MHLNPGFLPTETDQANRRVKRMGQRRAVNVIHLVVQGTYEERVFFDIADSRHNLLDAVREGNFGVDADSGNATNSRRLRDRLLFDDDGLILQPQLDPKASELEAQRRRAAAAAAAAERTSSFAENANSERGSDATILNGSAVTPARKKFRASGGGGGTVSSGVSGGASSNARNRTGSTMSMMMALDSQQDAEAAREAQERAAVIAKLGNVMLVHGRSVLGENPVMFMTMRDSVLDASTQCVAIFDAAMSQTLQQQDGSVVRMLRWRDSNDTMLRLQHVTHKLLWDIAIKDDVEGYSPYGELVMALMRQRSDPRSTCWARAQQEFAPFREFCKAFPCYATPSSSPSSSSSGSSAAQRAQGTRCDVDGWICSQPDLPGDVQFVVLRDPSAFLY